MLDYIDKVKWVSNMSNRLGSAEHKSAGSPLAKAKEEWLRSKIEQHRNLDNSGLFVFGLSGFICFLLIPGIKVLYMEELMYAWVIPFSILLLPISLFIAGTVTEFIEDFIIEKRVKSSREETEIFLRNVIIISITISLLILSPFWEIDDIFFWIIGPNILPLFLLPITVVVRWAWIMSSKIPDDITLDEAIRNYLCIKIAIV